MICVMDLGKGGLGDVPRAPCVSTASNGSQRALNERLLPFPITQQKRFVAVVVGRKRVAPTKTKTKCLDASLTAMVQAATTNSKRMVASPAAAARAIRIAGMKEDGELMRAR